MDYFEELEQELFRDVLCAEANYTICGGRKNKLATTLMGQLYQMLEDMNLTDKYLEYRMKVLEA